MNLLRKPMFYSTLSRLTFTLIIITTLYAGHAVPAYAQSCDPYVSPHLRVGLNVDQGGGQSIGDYPYEQLNAGWYHNYGFRFKAGAPTDIDFLPMFRGDNATNLENRLGPTIDAHPGEIWFAGNEPDRDGQDGILPQEYAEFYHEAYEFIKGRDPTAQIAFGGIVQPTAVRLEYLDRVVAAYNNLYGTNPPADIIHTHAFVMNEISWGAGMPPDASTNPYTASPRDIEPAEQWDLNLFKEQMVDMRQWMKDNGYQQKPLMVSEYGLLLPDVFYQPNGEAESVTFMTSTFDYMLNEKNAALGYAADDNRLVQQFAWFSLNYPKFDFETYEGLNGALFYRDTDTLTALGQAFVDFTEPLIVETVDLHVGNIQLSSSSPISTTLNPTVTVSAELLNTGGVVARDTLVTLWNGDPQAGGVQIATAPLLNVLPACQDRYTINFEWGVLSLPTGEYDLYITAEAANATLELNASDNRATTSVQIETALPTPEPTEVPVETPTPDPVETPTPEPTDVPVMTPTPDPVETPTPTDVPVMTPTPDPAVTPTPTEDPLETPTPGTVETPSPTPAMTAQPTEEPTNLPDGTATDEPSGTPTAEMTTQPTVTPDGTSTPNLTATSTSIPIVPIVSATPTPDDGTGNPAPVPTIPALSIGTNANLDMITSENNTIVYTIGYSRATGDPAEDVTMLAEIAEHTRFVAESSDSRWVCPASNAPGDICTLNLGPLERGENGTVIFALEFIYPLDEEIQTLVTSVSLQTETSQISDKTTITIMGQSDGNGFIYLPIVDG